MKGFGIGISSYGKAISFIFKNKLAWFFLFPLFLNISLFIAGTVAVNSLIDFLYNSLNESSGLKNAEFWGSTILQTTISGLMYIVLKIVYFFIFAYISGKIVIIFLSPVFSILSEKVDKIITGKEYSFSPEQTMRDIVRGILIALRNTIIELAIITAVFILGFIPIIGILISIVGSLFLFLVSSYFYGFSFMDYTNERRKLSVNKSVKFIRKNMGVAIGNGMIFSFSLLIPLCGSLIASFVSIVSVVAATLAMNEINYKS